MALPPRSLNDLPEEVVQTVLFYLPVTSLPTIHLTSRRLNNLADEPLLWRHHCRTQFKHWDPSHQIRQKLAGSPLLVDWKQVYISRSRTDRLSTRLLESILSSQTGRIAKFQAIVDLGYDVKDTLLRNIHTPDDTEDVLARRYYSNAVLSYLHRTLAIKEWRTIGADQSVPLERCLAAFDMFILRERTGDFDDISDEFDRLVDKFRLENPTEGDLTIRERSLALLRFIRANNLTGVDSDSEYHDLQNNFIGFALRHDRHHSLPLISVAIFCALAARLGINARPCAYPFHIYAVVHSPPALSLDGKKGTDGAEADSMYLDPFRSESETPLHDLHSQLSSLGLPRPSHQEYLGDAQTAEIVLRAARNIMQSLQEPQSRDSNTGTCSIDLDSALYAALWASVVINTPLHLNVERRRYLPHMMRTFEAQFPEDVFLFEQYLGPIFHTLPHYPQMLDAVRAVRVSDNMPKRSKPRDSSTLNGRVTYHVGQIFTHRRYRYSAVITGWDAKCEADEQWVQEMRVDELPEGRHQSFYHVLVEDKSVRYVAQENITPVNGLLLPSSRMMGLAGRHFKRWDRDASSFVSNVRDEYPDD